MPASTASRTVAIASSRLVGPQTWPMPPPPRVRQLISPSFPNALVSIGWSVIPGAHTSRRARGLSAYRLVCFVQRRHVGADVGTHRHRGRQKKQRIYTHLVQGTYAPVLYGVRFFLVEVIAREHRRDLGAAPASDIGIACDVAQKSADLVLAHLATLLLFSLWSMPLRRSRSRAGVHKREPAP